MVEIAHADDGLRSGDAAIGVDGVAGYAEAVLQEEEVVVGVDYDGAGLREAAGNFGGSPARGDLELELWALHIVALLRGGNNHLSRFFGGRIPLWIFFFFGGFGCVRRFPEGVARDELIEVGETREGEVVLHEALSIVDGEEGGVARGSIDRRHGLRPGHAGGS